MGLHALKRGKVAALVARDFSVDEIRTVAGWSTPGPSLPDLYAGVDEAIAPVVVPGRAST